MDSLAAVIITADSVRDNIDSDIKRDLVSHFGLDLRFEKFCQIKEECVAVIYPDMVQKPFYPALVHNMTFGPVLLLLVAGTDVYDVLTMAKGMFRSKDGQIEKSGLRLKYQGPSRQELVELGYEGERLLFRLFEYRIHTCDNLKETLAICKLLLSEGDYNVLVDELKGL